MAKRKEKPPEDTPSPPLANSLPLVVISIDNAFVQLHTLDLGSKLDDNSKTSVDTNIPITFKPHREEYQLVPTSLEINDKVSICKFSKDDYNLFLDDENFSLSSCRDNDNHLKEEERIGNERGGE